MAYREWRAQQAEKVAPGAAEEAAEGEKDPSTVDRPFVLETAEAQALQEIRDYGFTPNAQRQAKHGTGHIELIDLDRFLELWIAHYEKLSEEDKDLLRLRRVYFLAPEQRS